MHDLVVRGLEQARNRTLGLTDLDDPTLVTQHDPLMSPLVWDLAHVGQQEELWLLRAGDAARPGMLPPAVDAPATRSASSCGISTAPGRPWRWSPTDQNWRPRLHIRTMRLVDGRAVSDGTTPQDSISQASERGLR